MGVKTTMSGQTFRENVQQDVEDLFNQHLGDRYGRDINRCFEHLLPAVVDWAVERFGVSVRESSIKDEGSSVFAVPLAEDLDLLIWLTAENSWRTGAWIDAVAKRVGELGGTSV